MPSGTPVRPNVRGVTAPLNGERQRLIATSFDSSLLFVTACSLITPTPRACHFSSYCLSIVLYSSVSSVRLKRPYGVRTAPPPPSTWAWSTAPGRVLLPVGIAAVRVGEHDDAGLAVADAGLPGPVVLHPAPVLEVA